MIGQTGGGGTPRLLQGSVSGGGGGAPPLGSVTGGVEIKL
jgi:hypothetical protein